MGALWCQISRASTGKGIAKTFKEIYPEMFAQYQWFCEGGRFDVGQLWLYKTPHKWILNFPTKKHWRQPSKPEYIEAGLKKFILRYAELGITSIAFPRLGCGNGDLDWESVVQPLMVRYLNHLPIDIFIYENPAGGFLPEHRDIQSMKAWLRSDPHILAFEEVWEDLISAIGRGRELSTLEGEKRFKVVYMEGSDPEDGKLSLEMERVDSEEPELRLVRKEAMLDLWQNIRTYGFCLVRVMPQGLDLIAPYMVSLLSTLPYLKPIEVSHRAGGLLTHEIGLQLQSEAVRPLPPAFEVTAT